MKSRMKKWVLALALLAITAGFAQLVLPRLASHLRDAPPGAAPLKPEPERYGVMRADLEHLRSQLADEFATASDIEKIRIRDDSRVVLQTVLPELMRCWLGTPWDFNGISETPGEGKIACGYFVSTVLRDAGFKVPRIKLAQQPSQLILHTFATGRSTRHVGMSYEAFVEELATHPPGIFIVGLDSHVAFIINTPDEADSPFRFIHSSGAWPERCVVDESPSEASVLASSNYRIFGDILANDKTIDNWLTKTPFLIAQR